MAKENINIENETNNESNDTTNMDMKDLQNLDLLTTQSNAQLILMLGYYLEYIASQQAIELINLKYASPTLSFFHFLILFFIFLLLPFLISLYPSYIL